jgi:tRNA/rRNA methyltransferase
MATLLNEALRLSGYFKSDARASTEDKVRRLVRRLHVPADDATIWMGLLRQIVWKLRPEQAPQP